MSEHLGATPANPWGGQPETATQGGGVATPEPAAPTDTEGHAPAETGAATDQPEQKPAGDEADPAARRIARLTARYASTARERDDLAARIAQLEAAQRDGGQQLDPDFEKRVNERAEELAAHRAVQQRIDAFHEQGREAFADWTERCQALMAMGADAQLSQMLVELKDGPKVAAALHDDPDELERIAKLSTPTARAVALGQFAAKVEAKPAPRRAVSQAPAPIVPVSGRVQPTFNEYTATSEQLTEYYSKLAMEKRQQGARR